MAIEEGRTAPAFTRPDANGEKVALKDFRVKKHWRQVAKAAHHRARVLEAIQAAAG